MAMFGSNVGESIRPVSRQGWGLNYRITQLAVRSQILRLVRLA